MTIYLVLAALLVVIAVASLRLLHKRKLFDPWVSPEELNAWIDLNWQSSRPLERLLNPAEFGFLREHGLSESRVSQLRAKRRHLFRMYLRCLTDEFNTVYAALQLTMVSSKVDRAALAKILFTQRRLFYERLLGVQVRLALNAWGFDTVPSLELIRQLEVLRQEFYRLSPATYAGQPDPAGSA